MLTYSMEDRGGLSLYEHLYRCIRGDILSGTLKQGERLPSKRQLAEHLSVSVITVEGAYRQLEAEGYVSAQPRRGYFVLPVTRLVQSPEAAPAVLPPVPTEPRWTLDLKSNRVSTAHFPVATWAKLTRQVLSEDREALLRPLPHQGLLELRQALAEHLWQEKGMAVSPEQIVVGAGAEYLYLLLAQLLGREAPFAVEDPGYPKIRRVYQACGVPCVPVPLDPQGVDPAALTRSGAKVLHLSPSHQYPTGLVTPIGRRQELLRWAEDTEGIIIEDDYNSEFRFAGRPIPPLQRIDAAGRVIYLNTFSQTISPAMRLSFLVLPRRLLEQYQETLGFYASTVPALEQYVLSRFLSQGYFEQHLARMRKEYRLRRKQVLAAFRESPFAQRITLLEQPAGLHFLLHLETKQSDAVLRQRAESLGVRLSFLSEYTVRPTPHTDHTLVVNYAGLEPEALADALALLDRVFAP